MLRRHLRLTPTTHIVRTSSSSLSLILTKQSKRPETMPSSTNELEIKDLSSARTYLHHLKIDASARSEQRTIRNVLLSTQFLRTDSDVRAFLACAENIDHNSLSKDLIDAFICAGAHICEKDTALDFLHVLARLIESCSTTSAREELVSFELCDAVAKLHTFVNEKLSTCLFLKCLKTLRYNNTLIAVRFGKSEHFWEAMFRLAPLLESDNSIRNWLRPLHQIAYAGSQADCTMILRFAQPVWRDRILDVSIRIHSDGSAASYLFFLESLLRHSSIRHVYRNTPFIEFAETFFHRFEGSLLVARAVLVFINQVALSQIGPHHRHFKVKSKLVFEACDRLMHIEAPDSHVVLLSLYFSLFDCADLVEPFARRHQEKLKINIGLAVHLLKPTTHNITVLWKSIQMLVWIPGDLGLEFQQHFCQRDLIIQQMQVVATFPGAVQGFASAMRVLSKSSEALVRQLLASDSFHNDLNRLCVVAYTDVPAAILGLAHFLCQCLFFDRKGGVLHTRVIGKRILEMLRSERLTNKEIFVLISRLRRSFYVTFPMKTEFVESEDFPELIVTITEAHCKDVGFAEEIIRLVHALTDAVDKEPPQKMKELVSKLVHDYDLENPKNEMTLKICRLLKKRGFYV